MTGVGRRRPRTGQPGTRRRSVNTIPPQGRAVRVTQPQQHGVRQQHRSGSNSQGAPSRGRQGRQGLEQAHTLHTLRRHRGRRVNGHFAGTLRCTRFLRDQQPGVRSTTTTRHRVNPSERTDRCSGSEHSKKKHHCNSTTSSGWLSRNSGLDESQLISAGTTRPSRN